MLQGEQRIRKVVAWCLHIAMSDESWRDLGFRRRPRYGAFFERFLPKWKTQLYTRLLKELIILNSVAYIQVGLVPKDEINELVHTYLPSDSSTALLRAYNFGSLSEGRTYFESGMREYLDAGIDNWESVYDKRIELFSLKGRRIFGKFTLGSVQLIATIKAMAQNRTIMEKGLQN